MTQVTSTVDIVRAAAELKEVTAEFENADRAHRQASHARTAALNLLNAKQKQFADCVSAIKQASPADSDWKQSTRRHSEVHGVPEPRT